MTGSAGDGNVSSPSPWDLLLTTTPTLCVHTGDTLSFVDTHAVCTNGLTKYFHAVIRQLCFNAVVSGEIAKRFA